MQIVPNTIPLSTQTISSLSSSQTVTFDPRTNLLEVNAETAGVYMKWASSVTASDDGWHEYILPGTVRHYKLPQFPRPTQVSFIQAGSSASVKIVEKEMNVYAG
jgi:hypothetical protein